MTRAQSPIKKRNANQRTRAARSEGRLTHPSLPAQAESGPMPRPSACRISVAAAICTATEMRCMTKGYYSSTHPQVVQVGGSKASLYRSQAKLRTDLYGLFDDACTAENVAVFTCLLPPAQSRSIFADLLTRARAACSGKPRAHAGDVPRPPPRRSDHVARPPDHQTRAAHTPASLGARC